MKTLRFVGYLFHRYYSKGSRANIPYFSTICSMTFLGFIHLMQILVLLDLVIAIPINSAYDKLTKRLILILVMLPIYFLITSLFKKSDIESQKEKYHYDWDKVFRGNVWLVIYIILSFALTIFLAILNAD